MKEKRTHCFEIQVQQVCVYIELQADLTTNYYLLLSSKNVILLSQTYTQIFTHFSHPFLGTYEVHQFLDLGHLEGTHSNSGI